MKKIISASILSFMLVACGTTMAKNNKGSTTINVDNKDFQKMAAGEITASIRVTGSVDGSDTPTAEVSEKVSKITKATLSFFDSKMIIKNTYDLKKVDPGTKGEVMKFSAGYRPIPTDAVNFKLVLSSADNSTTYESEYKGSVKEKTIYKINGDLAQVSAKKDVTAPDKITLTIDELKAESYVQGEFIYGMKAQMKEEDVKRLLEENGIKVTEIRKGILSSTVKFSEPSTAEALLIATKLNRFDYVEPNGIVSIIGF